MKMKQRRTEIKREVKDITKDYINKKQRMKDIIP